MLLTKDTTCNIALTGINPRQVLTYFLGSVGKLGLSSFNHATFNMFSSSLASLSTSVLCCSSALTLSVLSRHIQITSSWSLPLLPAPFMLSATAFWCAPSSLAGLGPILPTPPRKHCIHCHDWSRSTSFSANKTYKSSDDEFRADGSSIESTVDSV